LTNAATAQGTANTALANSAENTVAIASNSAAIRSVEVVNATQSTLISQNTSSIRAVELVNSSQATAISALQTNDMARASQISALQSGQLALSGQVDSLFDLRRMDRRDTRQGIAAAVAIGNAAMPSGPGRTSYVFNGATFRGEYAVGGAISHRLNTVEPFAVTAGFSIAGNKNNAVKVGVAGEF
jgi:hypothetical protein